MPTAQPAATRNADFSGLWIPLITPFSGPDKAVDHPALKRLLTHYRHTGIRGYVVCGSTGEAAALGKTEQWEVLQTVLDNTDGLDVVMGYSGYNMADALDFVEKANAYTLHGLLVAAPHYIRPSQQGLVHWFSTLADASAHPLLVYDIPYRTGAELSLQTLRQLGQHRNIAGVKDCGGNAAKTQHLIADGQLQVLAGEDHQIFTTVASGGSGAISASAHVCTAAFAEVIRLLRVGDVTQAQRLWKPLLPVISALFAEPNPSCIKSALAQLGWSENVLREPLLAAQEVFDVSLLPTAR